MLYFSKYRDLILIIIFILLDQIIKILINAYCINNYYDISNRIAIKPMLNKDYSYVNSTFGIDMNLQTHIILINIILLILIIIYKYILDNNANMKSAVLGLKLLIAGCSCSLVDKIIWAGSLDYICIKGFLILDVKDIYLIIAEVILIPWILLNYQLVSRLSVKNIIRFVIERLKLTRE